MTGESTRARPRDPKLSASRWGWVLGATGIAALAIAFGADLPDAQRSVAQDWPPFVLVSGLLLIGLVADEDGLFAAAGTLLARRAPSGMALFVGSTIVVGLVTALLNLDTSVAFLTPVFVYAARGRGQGEVALLSGCLLLSNAGSLFLPGSNLTNLIVLGHLHPSGGEFLAHMWAPALAALLVTAAVIAAKEHRSFRRHADVAPFDGHLTIGLGVVAVIAATVLVLVLRDPAPAIAAVGIAAVTLRVVVRRQVTLRPALDRALGVLGVPVLVGLFGIAAGLGTLGRAWSGPAGLLSHVDIFGTGVVAALASVLVNNLPAASLLAAHAPRHPYALLVGLNVGPNLFVSGSLAWIIWLRAAATAGARPPVAATCRLGALAVPLAMFAALGVLSLFR